MRFLRCSYSVQSIALIIIIVIIWSSEAVRPPKTISVNKCCSAGERLSENFECIIDNDENWWPLIFMIIKQSYFKPNGSAPRFMKFHKQRPVCEKPELYIGEHKVALFSNGTLYISERHKFIEPQNYCIDRNVGIICDTHANSPTGSVQAINKMRKCCVQNAVYKTSDSTCVPMNGYDFNFPQYDIVFGFPACKVSKYFTIAETFKETNLDRDTNRLILETGRTLLWQEFCVEHVINKEMSQISVFTCADNLAVIQNTEENSYTVGYKYCYWILIVWSIHRFTLTFIAGYSFYFISDRITNICLLFVGNTGHKIFIAVESSSHSSLSLSNILHINIVDWRFTSSIYSSTTFTKRFHMHINRYVHN